MLKSHAFNFHLPFLKIDQGQEIKKLYLARLLRELNNKLILFFLPLYIYERAQSFDWWLFSNLSPFKKGFLLIGIFYLFAGLAIIALSIPVGKLSVKLGLSRSMFVANIFYFFYLLFLSLANFNIIFLFVAAMVEAFQTNFYWSNYYVLLTKYTRGSNLGKDLGFLLFFINFIMMVAPATGGLIIHQYGYSILYVIGLFLVASAASVCFSMKNIKIKDKIYWGELFNWLKQKGFRKLGLSFAGRYINDAALTLWPMYVFLLLGQADRVGILYSLSLFLSLVLAFFFGSIVDKKKSKKFFFLSGSFLSLLWFIRIYVINYWSVAFVDMFNKIAGDFHWLFFDKSWVLRGKGSQALSYFVYRKILKNITAIVFWTIYLLFFIVVDLQWKALFVFAAFGVILTLLISEKKDS